MDVGIVDPGPLQSSQEAVKEGGESLAETGFGQLGDHLGPIT